MRLIKLTDCSPCVNALINDNRKKLVFSDAFEYAKTWHFVLYKSFKQKRQNNVTAQNWKTLTHTIFSDSLATYNNVR